MNKLILGTRGSKLAVAQSSWVAKEIEKATGVSVELKVIKTRGDMILDKPLAEIGGKGLFTYELEQELLNCTIDFAVHSCKDLPTENPPGLDIVCYPKREDPRDALVGISALSELEQGARFGTSSLRRACQIRRIRPDLDIGFLRGNVNTRLAKLDAGEFDAIILATAGLVRLGFDARIGARIEPEISLPAGGQGAVGIEYRSDDNRVAELLAPLNDAETAECVTAERAVVRVLDGGCDVPIASYAVKENNELWLRALVGSVDGSSVLEAQGRGTDAESLGREVAQALLDGGAAAVLEAVRG